MKKTIAKDNQSYKSAHSTKEYKTEKERRHLMEKRIVTVVLAVALISSLGVTAYAISMSIHQKRQAEMKENSGMDNSSAQAHVEYTVPEENTSGVTLLSAMNDGSSQYFIVNASPVTVEDLALTQHPVMVSLDGGASWEQAMTAGDENTAYDAESQTLTVSCRIGMDGRKAGEEISLMFRVGSQGELGSITAKLTDPDTRLAYLSEPVALTNPVTGNPVLLLGAEFLGNQAIWMLETEDADYFYGDYKNDSEEDAQLRQNKIVTWVNWLDDQFRSMKLSFADGSSCSFSGHEFSDVDGNIVRPHVQYDRLTIDVSQLTGVEINGKTYDLK